VNKGNRWKPQSEKNTKRKKTAKNDWLRWYWVALKDAGLFLNGLRTNLYRFFIYLTWFWNKAFFFEPVLCILCNDGCFSGKELKIDM
jgi:hypothetical protein